MIYMKKVELKFKSRYKKVWSKLTKLNNSLWNYTTNSKFMRVINQTDDGDIFALDPEGGPYISIGSILYEKYKVVRIYRDYNDNKIKFIVDEIR